MISNEDIVLLLARELEWAEAFLEDHPECEMGWLYYTLIQRELTKEEVGAVGLSDNY